MTEFELPVTYKDQEHLFPAQFLPSGYTHRIVVTINGTEVFFEPDEEGSYRAFAGPDDLAGMEKIDTGLLQSIIESIVFVFG